MACTIRTCASTAPMGLWLAASIMYPIKSGTRFQTRCLLIQGLVSAIVSALLAVTSLSVMLQEVEETCFSCVTWLGSKNAFFYDRSHLVLVPEPSQWCLSHVLCSAMCTIVGLMATKVCLTGVSTNVLQQWLVVSTGIRFLRFLRFEAIIGSLRRVAVFRRDASLSLKCHVGIRTWIGHVVTDERVLERRGEHFHARVLFFQWSCTVENIRMKHA